MTGIAKPAAVVVNDDPLQLKLLAALLDRAGFGARAFEDAEVALAAMVADNPPDLVVTDLYMPGIDGWRFCRLLRSPEYAAFNEVPILVVSATFAGDHPERIAADVGADAFMPSPVDGKAFIAQVRALLAGKEARRLLRALIVDDEKTLAVMLQKAFAANGYEADTAHTVREAKAAFAKTPYDVAILDYRLPDGTGDELLDIFRAQRPDCVCLMMTTDPTPDLALDWIKRGASAYLRKPFRTELLVELCARARRERALLRVQDLLEVRTRELRKTTRRYRELFENSRDGFVVVDASGRILDANEAFCSMLGYSLPELRDKQDFYAITPERWRAWEREEIWCKRLIQTGASGVYEKEYIRKNGDVFPVELQSFVVKDDEDNIEYLWGVARDITERKLREKTMRLQALVLDQIQDRVTVTDLEGVITYVNHAEEQALGRPRGEIIGHSTDIYGEDSERGATQREILTTTLRDGFWQGEVLNRAANGREIMMDCRTLVVHNEEGKPVALAGFATDITERKAAELEREKLKDQLNQMQKLESVGRLAGGVAHDFNNVLSVILGTVTLALDQVDGSQPLSDDLREIEKAAERAAGLTRQLLAFARKQTVAPHVLNLNEAVGTMMSMLRRLIGENIKLVWKPGRHVPTVKLDPSQLDQLLTNLCVNARDAIADVGEISIETRCHDVDESYCTTHAGMLPGSYAQLRVSDNGCGIEHELLDHIFEPFFTTKEVGKGSGLGLATIYGIVKQNNGFVHVHSTPGRGTTINIHLPADATGLPVHRVSKPLDTSAQGTETVLLVEDEPAILNMASRMLEKLKYQVLAAATSNEALRLAREHAGKIHLLVTDVIMPEMNGCELAKRILATRPEIKTLFMSGYSDDLIAHHGVLDEGMHFIQKPLSMCLLAEKVREALDCVQQSSRVVP